MTVLADLPVVAEFAVVGIPVPQGSLKAYNRKGGGPPIVTADNKATRPWKNAVASEADRARRWVCKGPVAIRIAFRMPRLRSHFGVSGLLPSAPRHPIVKPDLDKLVRAVLDAIVEAQVIVDDAQVAELRTVKRYAASDEAPGVSVKVWALDHRDTLPFEPPAGG